MLQHQEKPYIVPFCERDIGILYQDDDIVVVEKPDLLLSIPGKHPLNRDSVLTRLKERYEWVNLVHRLDLDTSGILIAALSKEAHANLSQQFAQRTVDKSYTAVLDGRIEPQDGEINLPIIADWPNRPLQKICFEQGKPSLTKYQCLSFDENNQSTRVLFKPVTGRTHQLRIHAREIGHPILGCDMYAHEEAYKKSKRLLLHANMIIFTHPVTGQEIQLESDVPF